MKLFLAIGLFLMMAMGVWTDSIPIPTPALLRRCRRPSTQPGGPQCMAAFKKWRWNDGTRACEQFIYGGCRGTDNLFETKEACKEVCQLMTRVRYCGPPPYPIPTPATGCEIKRRQNMEDGCFVDYMDCPNKEPEVPCTPLLHTVALDADCRHIQVKLLDGCPHLIIDCSAGPPRLTPTPAPAV